MLGKGAGNVRTVAVMNEKGGSGKTTTTISLAAVLAERGIRVLVVDLNPQASASLWMGRGREPGLYRAIADRADLRPYVRSTAVQGIADEEEVLYGGMRSRSSYERPVANTSSSASSSDNPCPVAYAAANPFGSSPRARSRPRL